MAVKSYFIGIGGCGLKTVAEIYKRLGRKQGDEEYLYTCIDTDHNTIDKINNAELIIRPEDFISLGQANPYRIYHEDKKSHAPDKVRLHEWAINQETQETHLAFPDQPLNDGAQAERQLGRFGIYKGYGDVERLISSRLRRFQDLTPDADGKKDVDVWVIASSCGGTGSSMILDILHLVHNVAYPISNGAPNVKLVLYMPQPFIQRNRGMLNHSLNAYACMWEINAFDNLRDRPDVFQDFSVVPLPTRSDKKFPLFRYMIPVDCENDKGTLIDVESMYPTVAEMIYYLSFGTGQQTLRSHLSNEAPQLYKNAALNLHETVGNIKWTTPMIAYGYRAIRKPNKEFVDYLGKRGNYELLQYGLLDDCEDVDFNAAKRDFAREYILRYLLTIKEEEVTASGNSLEKQLTQFIRSRAMWDVDQLAKEDVRQMVADIDRTANHDEVARMVDTTYTEVCDAIDRGIYDCIINRGLRYAMKILNVVDDNYLEPLRDGRLKQQCTDTETLCNNLHKELDDFASKRRLSKKEVAALDECLTKYVNAIVRLRCLNSAIDIINRLCVSSKGYLEQLRRGSSTMTGLKNIIDRVEYACNDRRNAYDLLAKSFRATINDTMTIYLPSLVEMARGENETNWAAVSLFSNLYENSIIAHEELADHTKRPVRHSEDNLGLRDYLEEIDRSATLFLDLIKSDPLKFSSSIEQRLFQPLASAVKSRVDNANTPAGRWLSQSIIDAMSDPANKPAEFKSMGDMLSSFADINRVPVLYPVRQGATKPNDTRVMYVGPSKQFAVDNLGFDDKNHFFVQDSSLNDRYLIMCMPRGYDFWCYKYFLDIEKTYMNNRAKVRNGEYGCHIHQIFAQTLDIDKAIQLRGLPIRQNTMATLLRCLYYQRAIDAMRTQDTEAYNQLFGRLSTTQSGSSATASSDADFFKKFGNIGGEGSNSVLQNDASDDQFFTLRVDMQNCSIEIALNRAKKNRMGSAQSLAMVPDSSLEVSIAQQYLTTCSGFADEVYRTIDDEYLGFADVMDDIVQHCPLVKEFISRVHNTLVSELGSKQINGEYQLAMFIDMWSHNGQDKELVKSVINSIRSL